MSWRIDDHPEGDLQITHLVAPRFTARWTTGDFPIEHIQEEVFFWTDAGSGEEDAIYLWAFAWADRQPSREQTDRVMLRAVQAIEKHLMSET